MELIVNRTKADVDRLNALKAKGWANLTDSEKAEWHGSAAKGAYNYTDLNRVEAAVAELAVKAGLSLTTKTDWKASDVPTSSDMSRYLSNLNAIMAACPRGTVFPTIPVSMSGLTYTLANNIEEMLYAAETAIYRATHDMWEKFYCSRVLEHYQERTKVPTSGGTFYGTNMTFYRSYTFNQNRGYLFSDPVEFDPDTMTADDLIGLYQTHIRGPYTSVHEVTAITSISDTYIGGNWKYAAYADHIDTTYTPGTTSYGKFEVGEGVLPENGKIIAGSTSGEYLVLEIGGTLYYYNKIY